MHTSCTSGAYHERAGPLYAWALPSDNREWRHCFDRCQPYPLILQLKRALPWEGLCEVMTRYWRRADKNTDDGPSLP